MMPSSGAHVLVFPYPAQGHMIPLLAFTHHLATRGLTITIVVTPKNLHHLTRLLTTSPAVTPLVLPFPTHPSIPAGVENTAHLPKGGFRKMMTVLGRGLHAPLLDWFRNHPSPPVAIISDMFLGWTHHLACQLSIRRYAFFPSGALAVSFIRCLWRDMPSRRDGGDNNETVSFSEIPNCPIYPWWQLSPVYRSYVEGDPDSEFIKDSQNCNWASYGMVFNTFSGLEGVYLDYLKKELGHDRVWSIGPVLLPPDGVGPGERKDGWGPIASWLDTCSDLSVVYVCFGSQAALTNEQMEELTLGLEKSGVRFVLSVKGAIPLGFEDRVVGRGLVVKGWVPQVSILNHKSVCAFLTHCGWNSTLESIVAGVPMLAWPMDADQFLDATLLVDQLDVAVRVCEGAKTVIDSDDLARVLNEATSEKNKWGERRARAVALSRVALDAIKESGSSFNDLDGFVKHVCEERSSSIV